MKLVVLNYTQKDSSRFKPSPPPGAVASQDGNAPTARSRPQATPERRIHVLGSFDALCLCSRTCPKHKESDAFDADSFCDFTCAEKGLAGCFGRSDRVEVLDPATLNRNKQLDLIKSWLRDRHLPEKRTVASWVLKRF
ncbi:MAG: hypothetical protein U1F98_05720 [Verrucomicrobiota bacterium]